MRGHSALSILGANLCKFYPISLVCVKLTVWFLIGIRYINALEERVAFLEARLPDHAEDHYSNGLDVPENSLSMDTEEPPAVHQPRHSESWRDSISEDPEVDDGTSLVDGVAYLSLCASGTTDKTYEPYYVGSSSGATIARVIQSSIFRSSGNRAASQHVSTQNYQSSEASGPPAPLSVHSEEPINDLPDREQARMLFDVFFERIHTRWPLLDRLIYTKVFDNQYIQGSLTTTERSILHLIYAIAARFLSLTRKPCGVDYEVSLTSTNCTAELINGSTSSWQPPHQ
jgi:hypothetical protein